MSHPSLPVHRPVWPSDDGAPERDCFCHTPARQVRSLLPVLVLRIPIGASSVNLRNGARAAQRHVNSKDGWSTRLNNALFYCRETSTSQRLTHVCREFREGEEDEL